MKLSNTKVQKYPALKKVKLDQVWCTVVMPAFRRLRQEDRKFKACLGYLARPSQKKGNSPFVI
jgi:hypothetical protein